MAREVEAFVQALYDQEIIYAFDWPSWGDEARRYVSEPEAVENADLL
jgi:hypothetical protein